MYRAFNLTECDWKDISAGEAVAITEANSTLVRKALDAFLNKENGKIDGTKMREHWFPQIKADVFISHSHRDQTDAIKLAGYLKRNFGLDSFIDSCVWGYADDLLKQIDDAYCLNDNKETYSYEKRNRSTSHVHMMLSTALGMMIDTAECVIFMNSAQSITSKEAVSKTSSPWIYYELSLMSLIRRRRLEDYRPKLIDEAFSNVKRGAYAALPIEHTVSLGELTTIDADVLKEWRERRQNPLGKDVHSLDLLYKIAPKED